MIDIDELWKQYGPKAHDLLGDVATEAELAGLVAGEAEDWIDDGGPTASLMLVQPPPSRRQAARRHGPLGVATVSIALRHAYGSGGGVYVVMWEEIRGQQNTRAESGIAFDAEELAAAWEETIESDPAAWAKAIAEEIAEEPRPDPFPTSSMRGDETARSRSVEPMRRGRWGRR